MHIYIYIYICIYIYIYIFRRGWGEYFIGCKVPMITSHQLWKTFLTNVKKCVNGTGVYDIKSFSLGH